MEYHKTLKAPELPKTLPRDYVEALRFFATTWIVLGHFVELSGPGRGVLTPFLSRGHIAVGYYICLSGFVTQWAYGKKNVGFQDLPKLGEFYKGRLGRVLFSYYFSWVLGCIQRSIMHSPMRWSDVLLSGLVLDAWAPEMRLTSPGPAPNPAGWTIATLVFCWLLYPVVSPILKFVGTGSPLRLGLLAAVLYVCGALPSILVFWINQYAAPGQRISELSALYLYQFPPARLCEFMLGMASAEFARTPAVRAWAGWPVAAWAALIGIVLMAALVPYADMGRTDVEALFISCPAILWATLIAGCSMPSVSVATHPGLAAFGGYSFAVYLFQWLFYYSFFALQSAGCVNFFGSTYEHAVAAPPAPPAGAHGAAAAHGAHGAAAAHHHGAHAAAHHGAHAGA